MVPQYHRNEERKLRHRRVRAKVVGKARRPRLSIFCSNRYLYAQLIDDTTGRTLVSVNDLRQTTTATKTKVSPGTVLSAKSLGENLAAKAAAQKINTVVFDRGGYRYTGRVKAFALGARAGGLVF
ncbi:MAG: 50S ribosomal protein L18 [Patescibacteria group bacterium]